jgi:hypothetical protein
LLFGIPLIVSIGITPGLSFGFVPDSAHHQLSKGALPHEVVCSQDKTLVVRSNGKPACVKPGTGKNWEASGIGKTNPTADCKSGFATLENPKTGAIICENQSKASKYINLGWKEIDGMPEKKTTTPTVCKGGEVKLMNPKSGEMICENQDQAQKYIDEGWTNTDPMTDTISSSEVKTNAEVPGHMVQIEIVDVTVFAGDEPNVYVATIKLTAGDADVTKLRVIVVSDKESLPIDVNHLSAGKDTTSSIRIHADDPSTISANIQSYVPR